MKDKVIIIAEAGVNHNGDLNRALQLIEAAAEAGADYVKFQTFKTHKLVQEDTPKAEYQIANTNEEGSQFDMLKKLEIPENWYPKLIQHAKDHSIGFLSTGFDEESIDFLDQINIPFYKIPSGEITNKPFLIHIARKRKPVILSTGMADIEDIRNAVNIFIQYGIPKNKITILHCTTQYPTEMKDVNLHAMEHIAREFDVAVGYSDHTIGIEVPFAATAIGAKVIEKHFTMDKTLPGPDHLASLDPIELSDMVKGIRNIEMAMSGSGIKEPTNSEKKNIAAARKSIHIANDIDAGRILSEKDLVMLRPGDGISPMKIDEVIGRKTRISMKGHHKLKWEELI